MTPADAPAVATAARAEPARARGWGTAAAVAVVVAYAAVFHGIALRCGVISDGWSLLRVASGPWREALPTLMGSHFIPVTQLFDGILWRLLGPRDGLYQLANLLELTALAVGVLLLGRRLFRSTGVGLLAALLFLSNSSHYEVTLWAGVGNFHHLAALLCLVAVHAALRSGEARSVGWAVAFAAAALAAFFTYEPAISVVLAGALAAALGTAAAAAPGAPRESWRDRLRRAVPVVVGGALVTLVVLAVKAYLTATARVLPFFPPLSVAEIRIRALHLAEAALGIFGLRNHRGFLGSLVRLGQPLEPGAPALDAILLGWLVLLGAVAVALLRRGTPPVRWLTAWVTAHLLVISVAVVVESRHLYLATLPAALLSAALLWRGGELAAAWLGRRGAPGIPAPAAALVAALLLLPPAKGDHERAVRLFAAATAANRQLRDLVAERLAEQPPLREVVLVDLPAKVEGDGVHAYFFVSGMQDMITLTTGGAVARGSVTLLSTHPELPAWWFAGDSRHAMPGELATRRADPAVLVLGFDPATRTVRPLRGRAASPSPQPGDDR